MRRGTACSDTQSRYSRCWTDGRYCLTNFIIIHLVFETKPVILYILAQNNHLSCCSRARSISEIEKNTWNHVKRTQKVAEKYLKVKQGINIASIYFRIVIFPMSFITMLFRYFQKM